MTILRKIALKKNQVKKRVRNKMALTNNRKICPFKEDPKLISKINYKEYKFLKKFLTEQGKIIPGFVTGVSSKYQRLITKEIKKARNIALLPYVNDPRNI